MTRVVVESRPQFVDEVGEVPVDHECVRPEALMQLFLRNRIWPLPNQQLQELERLRGQGDRLAAAKELARARVQQAVSKAQPHLAIEIPEIA